MLSGGVFRHADPDAVDRVIARLAADAGGAGSVVGGTPVIVDRRYALAPIGLLAADHPDAAAALAADAGPGRSAPEGAGPAPRRRPR